MNQLNQTIQSLRVTIEVERNKENPDLDKIKSLEMELKECLKKVL